MSRRTSVDRNAEDDPCRRIASVHDVPQIRLLTIPDQPIDNFYLVEARAW
jgi:hypothetical protein